MQKDRELKSMLPDFDYPAITKATVIGERIVFVTIGSDDHCPDPTDDDGLGKIYSFSRRHSNRMDYDEGKSLIESNPDAVALSYFEHGNCRWSVAGDRGMTGGDWQWDGVDLAGVWVPDEYCDYEALDPAYKATITRRDWFVKQAESCAEIYTEWCNGNCYFYSIEVFKVRRATDGEVYDDLRDYRHDPSLEDDSCGGFIGDEYMNEQVLAFLKYLVEDTGTVASTV
jgi:hypothetical protein